MCLRSLPCNYVSEQKYLAKSKKLTLLSYMCLRSLPCNYVSKLKYLAKGRKNCLIWLGGTVHTYTI